MSNPDPKTILVATDLTPASEGAVAFAADIADSLEARVILLHAISPLGFVDYGVFEHDTMKRATERQLEAVEQKLKSLSQEFFPQHVEVVPRAMTGYPITSICETAESANADFIVMGTHGRNPVTTFLVGSVVKGVLHRTTRPLITVPKRSDIRKRTEILTILCPINFTPVSMRALEHAAAVASKLGAEVVALHLVEPEELTDPQEVTRQLEQWIPKRIRDLSEVRVLVQRGNAAEEVIRYAQKHSVDLIVIGAAHKRFADTTVLGTTTERVTRHASCPVMSVMMATPEEKKEGEQERELAGVR